MALDLLREMTHKSIGKDTMTSNAAISAISACEKAQRWTLAHDLLREMTHEGIGKDMITCAAAISACEKGSS